MAFGQLDGNAPPQPVCEINMTPLVDVMLVLLIIFIVTAPMLTRSVHVNLPKVNARAAAIKGPVVVSLTRELQLFLENRPVSREVLVSELQGRMARGEQPTVELHVDGDIAYNHVVRLMALVQGTGITKIAFMTEPERTGGAR